MRILELNLGLGSDATSRFLQSYAVTLLKAQFPNFESIISTNVFFLCDGYRSMRGKIYHHCLKRISTFEVQHFLSVEWISL